MKFLIFDSSDNNPVEVKAQDWSREPGIEAKIVTITQSHGALHFQHGMTVNQARAMSDALLACCIELEKVPA